MLACGHNQEPFGAPICAHLRECRQPWLSYVRWYTGRGMNAELLCHMCVKERDKGELVATEAVCKDCFAYATAEIGDLSGVRGKPEIRSRPEPFDLHLRRTRLPSVAGKIIDLSPLEMDRRSLWLLLDETGALTSFDADTGENNHVASVSLISEPDHETWCNHVLKPHLHCSRGGHFAAIVNDYGRYGQIIDLRTGHATKKLDGGGYHSETVPFSFAFARLNERIVAIHRTDWNRLDVSDPATGGLLTTRGPTSYQRGEERPPHYLDYFHGALWISPNSIRIADDGWVWHPVGVPTTWNLEKWISDNVWESEDGPTRKEICARTYYWDHSMTWLDDNRFAISGLGDDDNEMIDGARIFDVSLPGNPGDRWRTDWAWSRELIAFAGPVGKFFSDGKWLFSSDGNGLTRWDINDGCCTGYFQGFQPTHHHKSANELAQVGDDDFVRWTIGTFK